MSAAFILLLLVHTSVAIAFNNSGSCGPSARNYTLRLTPGFGAPDGFGRSLLLVNGQTPGPLVEANQGETFAINVVNQLDTLVGMHWHGLHQRGTPEYDGVPGLNQYAIPPGRNMTYCFSTDTNYGAYWYHVHLRDMYQDGIRGPILIHPSVNITKPFYLISNVSSELEEMRASEMSSKTLMINDWYHETGDAIINRLAASNDSMQPLCASSILFNGKGRVQCPPTMEGLDSFGCISMAAMMGGSMNPSTSTLPSASTMSSPMETSMGAASTASTMMMPGMRRRSPFLGRQRSMMDNTTGPATSNSSMSPSSPSFPNPTCQNTSAPLYVQDLGCNATWSMLHLINAGASQQLAFSIDEHDLWIVSADGAYVIPRKVQVLNIGIGQRYGILFKRPSNMKAAYTMRASAMTHQTYQGSAVISYSCSPRDTSMDMTNTSTTPWIDINGQPITNQTAPFVESSMYPLGAYAPTLASREIRLDVNQSEPTVWVLQKGQPFGSNSGQVVPLLFEPRDAPGVFTVYKEETINIVLQIAADSLDNMAHPIHLHGHYFRVLGSMANSTFPTNMTVVEVATSMSDTAIGNALDLTQTAPMRDSAHLPEGGWLVLQFLADNPGVWMLHCHINSHLSTGMAVAFVELPDKFPKFDASLVTPPRIVDIGGQPSSM